MIALGFFFCFSLAIFFQNAFLIHRVSKQYQVANGNIMNNIVKGAIPPFQSSVR